MKDKQLAWLWLLLAATLLAPYAVLPLGLSGATLIALFGAAGWLAAYDVRAPLPARVMASLAALAALGWLAAALVDRVRMSPGVF